MRAYHAQIRPLLYLGFVGGIDQTLVWVLDKTSGFSVYVPFMGAVAFLPAWSPIGGVDAE